MLVGYARISTMDQNPTLQIDALREAGCERIFTETASGAHRNRPQPICHFRLSQGGGYTHRLETFAAGPFP